MSEADTGLGADGCLTPEGVAALVGAAPGAAPEPLARHLAHCARCQERVLAGGLPRKPRAQRKAFEPPSLSRALLLLGLVLAAMLAFLWTLRQLAGQ
jgi:hypothetical protein